jgi:septum site-determining protein MinC
MIAIKGIRQGLLIVFTGDSEPWLTKLRELEDKLNANAAFFQGGLVAFDVRGITLGSDDVSRAIDLLEAHNVKLIALLTDNDGTRRQAQALGLADTLPAAPPAASSPPQAKNRVALRPETEPIATDGAQTRAQAAEEEQDRGTDGALLKRRVRSGQLIKHPGHIVVVGDVNPGAQIMAGGDIIVWGRLQGSAHAGAFGNLDAVVCALEMTPTLIKIADLTVRNHKGKAEMARVKEQEIVFTKWDRS